MADGMKVMIEGTEYDLDNEFTLGELEWLEDYVGKPLTNESALNSIRAAVGLVFIVKRRANPAFSIEEARAMDMSALAQPDPEKPAAKRPPKPAART